MNATNARPSLPPLPDRLVRAEAEFRETPAVTIRMPPAPFRPTISVIVPVHNQLRITLRCLDALARNAPSGRCEVIVVDDASSDATFLHLSSIPHLRVVRNFTNLGFVRSCNRGASLARGEYLLLLNSDAEIQPGCLESLLETFALREDAGLVGTKLIYPDGSLQEAGGIVWSDGTACNYGRHEDADLPAFNFLRETDYCSGACLMIPTVLWRKLGGFDSRYAPAYYEDTDLAFRVREAGLRVYYQPKAVVIHHEGVSNGTDPSRGIKAFQARHLEVFRPRWQATLAREHADSGQDLFRARERSRERRIVLVIDHYVPQPDKDAGSRNILTYIRFLLQAGFSVKFIGDSHDRHPAYSDQLERLGVEMLVGAHFAASWKDWFAENGSSIDYVLLSRAHTAVRWLPTVREHTAAKVLYYGHDLLSRTLRRAADRLGDPALREQAEEFHQQEQQVFPAVDYIYYPSPDEVAFLRDALPASKVNRLPLFAFSRRKQAPPNHAEREGLLFVGGFAHPPNVDAINWFIAEVWPRVRELLDGVSLTIVGSNPPPDLRSRLSPGIRLRSDITEAELQLEYSRARLAIVPLRYGGGIKGKILEAMDAGTPVVSTEIGAEGIGARGCDHLEVSAESDFAASVAALYRDAVRWERQQKAAWDFLDSEYSEESLRRALSLAIPELAQPSDAPGAEN